MREGEDNSESLSQGCCRGRGCGGRAGHCLTSHRHSSVPAPLSSPSLIPTVRDSEPTFLPSPPLTTTDDSNLTPNCHCPVSPGRVDRYWALSTPFQCSANTMGNIEKKVSVYGGSNTTIYVNSLVKSWTILRRSRGIIWLLRLLVPS